METYLKLCQAFESMQTQASPLPPIPWYILHIAQGKYEICKPVWSRNKCTVRGGLDLSRCLEGRTFQPALVYMYACTRTRMTFEDIYGMSLP